MEKLHRVLPPPTQPNAIGLDRDEVARRLRTPLPDDYFEFANRYGDGAIDAFLMVLLPSSTNTNVDLPTQCERLRSVLETVRSQTPDSPYVGYPAPGGLVPWGKTENGDVCFWKTGDPDPNRWPVVLCDGRMWDWEQYPGTMTQFLGDLLSRDFRSKIFPEDFPSPSPMFEVQ